MQKLRLAAVVVAAGLVTGSPLPLVGPGAGVALAAEISEAAEVDQSSPKAALRSLYQSMFAGNIDGMRQLLVLDTDEKQEVFGLLAPVMAESGKLASLSQKTFGLAPSGMSTMDLDAYMKSFEQAEVTEEGDTAKVVIPLTDQQKEILGGQELPATELTRVDGDWKISSVAAIGIDAALLEGPPEQQEMMKASMNAMATVARELQVELEAGEFDSAEAVGQAMMNRSMAIMQQMMADLQASEAETDDEVEEMGEDLESE
jgi:hypothetical protein